MGLYENYFITIFDLGRVMFQRTLIPSSTQANWSDHKCDSDLYSLVPI